MFKAKVRLYKQAKQPGSDLGISCMLRAQATPSPALSTKKTPIP